MTEDEYRESWAFARALFPKAEEPKSQATPAAWGASLIEFSKRDLCNAFQRCAQHSPYFPELARLREAARDERKSRSEDASRLAAPRVQPLAPEVTAIVERISAALSARPVKNRNAREVDPTPDEHDADRLVAEYEAVREIIAKAPHHQRST